MRRKDKEVTDQSIIQEIIDQSQLCRIALFDDEYPYIVPFNYGYSDQAFYFHSATSGKKIDLIRRNNKVCFEIEYFNEVLTDEKACKWTSKYRSIVGFGVLDFVVDPNEKKKGMDAIMKHYGRSENLIYDEKVFDRVAILKLSVTELTAKQSGDWTK